MVVAVRSPAPSAEELRRWAAAHVATSSVPREYTFAEVLPLGGSRKVLKRVLREQLAARRFATVRPGGG